MSDSRGDNTRLFPNQPLHYQGYGLVSKPQNAHRARTSNGFDAQAYRVQSVFYRVGMSHGLEAHVHAPAFGQFFYDAGRIVLRGIYANYVGQVFSASASLLARISTR